MSQLNASLVVAIKSFEALASSMWSTALIQCLFALSNDRGIYAYGWAQALSSICMLVSSHLVSRFINGHRRDSAIWMLAFFQLAAIGTMAWSMLNTLPSTEIEIRWLFGSLALWGVAQGSYPAFDSLFVSSIHEEDQTTNFKALSIFTLLGYVTGPLVAGSLFLFSQNGESNVWSSGALKHIILIGQFASLAPLLLSLFLSDTRALDWPQEETRGDPDAVLSHPLLAAEASVEEQDLEGFEVSTPLSPEATSQLNPSQTQPLSESAVKNIPNVESHAIEVDKTSEYGSSVASKLSGRASLVETPARANPFKTLVSSPPASKGKSNVSPVKSPGIFGRRRTTEDDDNSPPTPKLFLRNPDAISSAAGSPMVTPRGEDRSTHLSSLGQAAIINAASAILANVSDVERQEVDHSPRIHSFVPYLIVLPDIILAFAAGLTVRFFPIFLQLEVSLPPSTVCFAYAVQPLSLALFAFLGQFVSRSIGATSFSTLTRFAGIWILLYLTVNNQSWHQATLVVPLLIVRASLMNAEHSLMRNMLMESVPQEDRMKWLRIEDIKNLVWALAVGAGGVLIQARGFQDTFRLTVGLQALAWVIGIPLICMLPGQSTSA